MRYKVSAPHPVNHLIEIELAVDTPSGDEIIFQLPSWRPGRYELGNFARNIQRWQVSDEKGMPLPYRKTGKDTWRVSVNDSKTIVVRYNYYAAQLDAGACWLDEHQLYMNPVHCMLFVPERVHENCEVCFDLPMSYKLATSMEKLSEHVVRAQDYHELVDSPVIASPSLQHKAFTAGGTIFNIWFQGECKPEWSRIVEDFRKFSEEQIRTMVDFPVNEFHFLVQVLPFRFYHGVEHLKSTVLALGPGSNLMDTGLYVDFLGVASHELFHSWNIKTIRPAEMLPYDYTKENYSRLGFVYEGVTTYYGDLFLVRAGVYSVEQFFTEINVRIQKHFDNYGRFNLSVADSSFDTWLDGYGPGIPNRKTSIYDEGCLIALMTDIIIRSKSKGVASLDEVMRTLYRDFGKRKIGYTEHDYLSIIEKLAGEPMAEFFVDYIYGTENYEPLLTDVLNQAGCQLNKRSSPVDSERLFGFKTIVTDGKVLVKQVAPDSPADRAGLGKDEEIISVNEMKVSDNLQDILHLFAGEKVILTTYSPMQKMKDIALVPSVRDEFFPLYSIGKKEKASPDEQRFFKAWLKMDFYPAGQKINA
ncbi:MAG TPA: PDZ domain-containing protein [Bacteroidia bacterium]|nr:PDZ domain-containing protein [Bacteroidia bacterium]